MYANSIRVKRVEKITSLLCFLICQFSLLGVSQHSYATENVSQPTYSQQDIEALNQSAQQKAQSYQTQALQLNEQALATSKQHEDAARQTAEMGKEKWLEAMAKLKNQYIDDKQLAAMQKQYHGLLIFASLWMPEASLKALVKQADQVGAPIIIQGLYKNSFQLTADKIFDLVKPEKAEKEGGKYQGGIVIDPNWFKMYGITKVPAFVITHQFNACLGGKDCKVADYDILTGNISAQDALTVFKRKGQRQFQAVVEQFLSLTDQADHR
ncbi:type-F conjugative transfer system pilin assembly protein TrbC [Fastidiosibacter lacustris]|uniref:type-F conjugative transfer system pilin assembly protein TrbC n=1 Tax=Fastidiosibacter lacustris TaxID=2056695 RepID=UPI001300B84A|nr:type-F conjugative transfer system pilin assembly protein TrbC [Fastidiosibacter lacustris]